MKEILVTLEPQGLREESERCEEDLEEHLETLVESATSKAISTNLASTSSGGGQGISQTQMSDLVEETKDLHIKLDAALHFVTLLKSDMIQDFNGIEIEERE